MGDSLETAQYFIFVTQIHFCCMYAVVVWDWITSIQKEWRLIWHSEWTPIKALYLFCRYWVLVTMPYVLFCFCADHSQSTCDKIFRSPVAIAMWNQAGAEAVLLVRTYAFFGRKMALLAALIAMLLGVIIYQLFVDIKKMLPLPFAKPPFTSGPCLPMSIPGSAHLLGYFVAPLAFDTIVTIMTVFRAVTMRRRNGPASPIIKVFLREGVFYYLLISVANLVNGIFYFQPRAVMSAIMIPLSVMLAPVLACRLILDIRARAADGSFQFPSTGSRRGITLEGPGPQAGGAAARSKIATSSFGSPYGAVTGLRTDNDIELGGVSPQDYKEDVEAYRSVAIPSMNKIRVDVETGIVIR